MRREDSVRFRHMLDAAKEAISFAKNKARNNLDNNRMLVLSLVKSIEIIGEAASKVTNETKEKFPKIPWANMIAMRNRLIHAYFDIDLDVLWGTIIDDLPPFIDALESIISSEILPNNHT